MKKLFLGICALLMVGSAEADGVFLPCPDQIHYYAIQLIFPYQAPAGYTPTSGQPRALSAAEMRAVANSVLSHVDMTKIDRIDPSYDTTTGNFTFNLCVRKK